LVSEQLTGELPVSLTLDNSGKGQKYLFNNKQKQSIIENVIFSKRFFKKPFYALDNIPLNQQGSKTKIIL
jgi:hypothetical protein